MKIRVQHENGEIETLTVKGPLRVSEGKYLDSFSRKGWGTLVCL